MAADASLRVSGRTIDLWRATGPDEFQFIQLDFDKYRAPRIQMRFGHLSRQDDRWAGHEAASVVPPRKRYFHHWGKPRWRPSRWWSDAHSQRTVQPLVPMLAQVLRYFETGESGPNLGVMLDHSQLVAAFQKPECGAD